MKSSTTVFLHIGTNKTGTTAIQQFFAQHREALKDAGLLYPTTGCMETTHYGLTNALGFVQKKATKPTQRANNIALLQEQFRQEIEQSAVSQVLFSSECFILRRPLLPVKQFFSEYNTKIVVYLRRHDDWWESLYNQAVKTVVSPPWGQGFDAYFDFINKASPHYSSYRHLIDRWARVFGKKNIIVRPYESGQNQPDIVSDLLQAIGFTSFAQQMPYTLERSNESLSPLALHLVDIYQRTATDSETRARLIRHAISLTKTKPRTTLLSPEQRRQLIAQNSEDYRYIAKQYLGRKDEQLFYAPLPELDSAWQVPAIPSTVALIEETIKALSEKPEPSGSKWFNFIHNKLTPS